MDKKSGVTMLILILIIILVLILVGITIASAGNTIDNARLVAFATDLTRIEDATKNYYFQNNSLPITDETSYLKDDILQIVKDENKDSFIEALNLNEDNGEDTSFYKIELGALEVEQTTRGTKKNGKEEDVYVVAFPSMNVYYLAGVKAKGNWYYALTPNLVDLVKLDSNVDNTDESTYTAEGLIVKKKNKIWTNKFEFTIIADIDAGDTLSLKLNNSAEKQIQVTTGQNIINFNGSIKTCTSNTLNKEISLGITDAEIASFNSTNESKVITIYRKNAGSVLGEITLKYDNYDSTLPVIEEKNTISSGTTQNTLTFKASDTLSGIKEVRYEYLKKYDENGSIEDYYSVNSFDEEYMKGSAKKATVKNGEVTINVPKNIYEIEVVAFDKAGNASVISPLPTKTINTGVFIGIDVNRVTENTADLRFAFNTSNKINVATVSYSLDGKNYSDEIALTINNNGNNIYSSNFKYENLNLQVGSKLYVKVKANYGDNKTEVRIKQIDITNKVLNSENLGEGTRNRAESAWNKPYVPSNFHYVEGTVNDGYVIADAKGNEFVWIPVDGVNVEYEKWCEKGLSYADCSDVPDEEYPEGITAVTESSIVNNAGGFYIGRYEAGVPEGQTAIDGTSAATSNVSGIPVSKKKAVVWTNIDYTNANNNAKSYMNNSEVASGLLTGKSWDTVCKWLQNSDIDVDDSSTYGSYRDSQSPANVEGYGNKQVTGYSENWKVKNIYDLAGNTWEWTNEIYSSNRVYRGGGYNRNGIVYTVCYRGSDGVSRAGTDLSFRVQLYIK